MCENFVQGVTNVWSNLLTKLLALFNKGQTDFVHRFVIVADARSTSVIQARQQSGQKLDGGSRRLCSKKSKIDFICWKDHGQCYLENKSDSFYWLTYRVKQ